MMQHLQDALSLLPPWSFIVTGGVIEIVISIFLFGLATLVSLGVNHIRFRKLRKRLDQTAMTTQGLSQVLSLFHDRHGGLFSSFTRRGLLGYSVGLQAGAGA